MDETFRSEAERIFLSAPFIAEIGLRLESVASGECRTSLALSHKHLQHGGFVHAGVQATMADHTAGAAATSVLRPDQAVLTAEFKINLLRSARGDALTCTAKVLKAGASLIVVESEVFCGSASSEPRLVAKAMVTLAVVARRSAE